MVTKLINVIILGDILINFGFHSFLGLMDDINLGSCLRMGSSRMEKVKVTAAYKGRMVVVA